MYGGVVTMDKRRVDEHVVDMAFSEKAEDPDYTELLIEMVKKMQNKRFLKMIYAYVKSAYNEEKRED